MRGAKKLPCPLLDSSTQARSLDANTLLLRSMKGLKEGGYVDGHNITIEYRWANDRYDRLAALADELIPTGSDAAALAAKDATTTIPIVFGNSGDPVKTGLVGSLSRPGGYVTGVTFFTTTLASKRLELLRELVPNLHTIGVLTNPNNPSAELETKEVLAAANSVGQRVQILAAATEVGITSAFEELAKQPGSALLVNTDPYFLSHRDQIVVLENRHWLPTVHTIREWTVAGGLMSYGIKIADGYRQVAVYAGQIIKGANPAECRSYSLRGSRR